MFESYFCINTALPNVCSWSWKIVVTFVLCFLFWKFIFPKKNEL